MTAREQVLGRVRDALALAPAAPVTVDRGYRTGRTLPDDERLALFTDRLVDYKATVRTCTAATTATALAAALDAEGARRIGVPPGLDRSWLAQWETDAGDAAGAEGAGRRRCVEVDSAAVPLDRLDALDGVVTASAVSCAETGTIFLDGSPDQGRRALSLVPDLHVCVVDLSTVEAGVPEALSRLIPERPTTLISGPSATSDIELERVEGVHGPRTLVVLLRTDV